MNEGTGEVGRADEADAKKKAGIANAGRGFASMDPEKQRAIASAGGRAAHAEGRAHQFTADEARAAGRKGGAVVARDRQHMAEIGRLGGQNRGKLARAKRAADKA